MQGKKVVIIGGSVAGCAIGALLQRIGLDVQILERSSGNLIDNGAGITLPEALLKKCIELDLFNTNIPHLAVHSRSFNRKNEAEGTMFWHQAFNLVALNWAHIYQNLRKRVTNLSYRALQEVNSIRPLGTTYTIETTTGDTYQADLVIAADGVDSTIRTQLFPNFVSDYTGYVAWRGLVEKKSIAKKIPEDHALYYVFPNGHFLLYTIPAKDYLETGKTLLNWLLYETRKDEPLAKLLIDDKGKQHARSLPAGNLTIQHEHYLHDLAQRILPASTARIICQTQQPFLQAIFDFVLPDYTEEGLIFMGDAALTLRPHSGSGTAKALSNAIELAAIIEANGASSIATSVQQWKAVQQKYACEELPKAKIMGAALVTNPPDWQVMNQESTTAWWASIMQGKKWYATDKTNATLFSTREERIK